MKQAILLLLICSQSHPDRLAAMLDTIGNPKQVIDCYASLVLQSYMFFCQIRNPLSFPIYPFGKET